MATYLNETFVGERALFKTRDAYVEECTFEDGESPLKEAKDVDVVHCDFGYKYPLWYGKDINVIESLFRPMARAGVWYTKDAHFVHCTFEAPKLFRKCKGLSIEDAEFSDAQETLWWNSDVTLTDAIAKNGDYFGMGSKNMEVDHLDIQGNYAFDGCSDLVVRNSVLRTKDAFWNCKRVTVENCYIEGEYFGWNSEDVTLIHCEIRSHQGFCYMKNVKLVDCRVVDTDLAFEYCSDIDADIVTTVDSIKNPISGVIRCAGVGELIFDDPKIKRENTRIEYGE
ncbi:MAG: DUF3737 family protein [Bacilli bacterium]|nr:DUF3737 family protein [Bacilli bacterium]